MPASRLLYLGGLGLLCLERAGELAIARRNARAAFAAGGVESGRAHFPAMVAFHALFPLACAAEVLLLRRPFPGALGWSALACALAAQALRWWCIASLGRAWNVRVIVVPGSTPIRRGPYRALRHPNYLAVVIEMAAVPLIHGAWLTAIVASLGNAALLAVRIPCEMRALRAASGGRTP
jgi:methyltransferase